MYSPSPAFGTFYIRLIYVVYPNGNVKVSHMHACTSFKVTLFPHKLFAEYCLDPMDFLLEGNIWFLDKLDICQNLYEKKWPWIIILAKHLQCSYEIVH